MCGLCVVFCVCCEASYPQSVLMLPNEINVWNDNHTLAKRKQQADIVWPLPSFFSNGWGAWFGQLNFASLVRKQSKTVRLEFAESEYRIWRKI